MKNLFIVDGASGTGKSDLIRWVSENNANDTSYVTKATTRHKRHYELDDATFVLDLDFISDDEFAVRNFEYSYKYGGFHYGFGREQLNRQLLDAQHVFVIVRNIAIIRRLQEHYHFMNVVPVFIYAEHDALERRLRRDHLSDEHVTLRLKRSAEALRDYYAHPDAYRETLINNSSNDVFHNTIQRLIDKHSAEPLIDPHLVCVLMSFNPANRLLDDYYDAMERAVRALSPVHRCARVDRAPGSPRIADEFRSLVRRARCAVVDLTENKQNVYYELGYAHARGRTCIITAAKGTDPSFYPREHKILFYENARDLETQLAAELRAIVGGPAGM